LLEPESFKLNKHQLKAIPRWRKKFPSNFGDTGKKAIVEENEEWDPGYVDIDCYKGIGSAGSINTTKPKINGSELLINIDWRSMKSPYEFFAYLLKFESKNHIKEFYEHHLKQTLELDNFYGNPSNRKPVEGIHLAEALKSGPAYAIYESSNETMSGSFRRVQVISIRNMNAADMNNEFCRVRFLDVGGTDIVPLAGLLKIHSRHCNNPPMCVQLYNDGMKPPKSASDWSEEERKIFKKLARSDIPLKCNTKPANRKYKPADYKDPPQDWPGVLFVTDICPHEGDTPIESKMVEDGHAKRIRAGFA